MYNCSRFRITDILVVACILILAGIIILPAMLCSAGRSREAVCRNNLKLIGTGLELWKQHAGRYPFFDLVDGPNLLPWPDILAMQKGYTPEKVELMRAQLKSSFNLTPEDFSKTVEDDKIFMCPGDHPNPHRINQARSSAWGFYTYEYSYALAYSAHSGKYHQRTDQQMLSADGVWTWSQNFSGEWVTNPSATYDTGGWWCNTVGYWHKGNSANILLRDLHIENYKYPPDTTKIFEWESGESLTVLQM